MALLLTHVGCITSIVGLLTWIFFNLESILVQFRDAFKNYKTESGKRYNVLAVPIISAIWHQGFLQYAPCLSVCLSVKSVIIIVSVTVRIDLRCAWDHFVLEICTDGRLELNYYHRHDDIKVRPKTDWRFESVYSLEKYYPISWILIWKWQLFDLFIGAAQKRRDERIGEWVDWNIKKSHTFSWRMFADEARVILSLSYTIWLSIWEYTFFIIELMNCLRSILNMIHLNKS